MKKFLSIIILLILIFSARLKGQDMPHFMYATGGGIFTGIGDLKSLNNEKLFNVVFTYDSMAVDRFSSESDFFARIKKKFKDDEAGEELWIEEWNDNKTRLFEPMFLKCFNEEISKYGVGAGQQLTDTKYTILVSTTFIHIGWSLNWEAEIWTGHILANNESEVQLKLFVYEVTRPEKLITKFSATGFFSAEKDESSTGGLRIASVYKTAGKEIGKFLCKKSFKFALSK